MFCSVVNHESVDWLHIGNKFINLSFDLLFYLNVKSGRPQTALHPLILSDRGIWLQKKKFYRDLHCVPRRSVFGLDGNRKITSQEFNHTPLLTFYFYIVFLLKQSKNTITVVGMYN